VLADDPCLPKLVQAADHGLFVLPAGRDEDLQGELPAHDRCQLEHVASGLGEPAEARLDHGLHRRRQQELPRLVGEPGPHGLDDEQRVPFGLAIESLGHRPAQGTALQLTSQLGGGLRVEA
jgi:hypothetical protein